MKKRQAGYELLRVIAMLMIVTLHYLDKGQVMPDLTEHFAFSDYLAWLIEAFCLMSVNVYVLLSGYFGVTSSFRVGKAVALWGQVFFYSIGIALISCMIGIVPIQSLLIYDWFGYLFPIATEHYWFATAYLFLYFLMPFLNTGLEKLEKKELQKILIGLYLFTAIAKTCIPMNLATDKKGYDVFWFVIVYLTGAYIRKYVKMEKTYKAVLLYVGSTVCLFGMTMALRFVWSVTGALENFMGYAYCYNHVLCLVGAVGLFLAFQNVEIRNEKAASVIGLLSSCTFGVYLIHEHRNIRYVWPIWLKTEETAEKLFFIVPMIGTVLLVFGACVVLEICRKKMFAFVYDHVRKNHK